MAVVEQVTLAKYLSTPYSPDCDYVDGVLEDRNVGEKDHSKLQMAVSAYFYNRRKELGIHVFPEQRIQISATRYRVPDICVTLSEPEEQIFIKPPFLCVEILSPEDRAPRILRKVNDYLRIGVPFIWTIDPKSKEAIVYCGEAVQPVNDGVLWTRNPDFRVPILDLFD
jgi:Uma2 family endonuclease